MNIPASLPSPSSGTLQLGPLALNAYGLLIALGVLAAVKLASSRLEKVDWQAQGIAPGDLIFVHSSATPGQIGHVGIAPTPTTWIQAVGTGIPVRVRGIPAPDKIRAVRRVL